MTYPPGATEMMREVIHSSCQWPAALQVQYAPVGSRSIRMTIRMTGALCPRGFEAATGTADVSLCPRGFEAATRHSQSLTPEPEVPAGRRRDRSNRVRDLRSVA